MDNVTPANLAWELNKKGIPSPRGGRWHGHTIQRILMDETHLGKIISNKTVGDGHKIKRSKDSKDVFHFPREQWVIVENCHEAVKTQEEHDKCLMFFSRMTKTPRRKTSRVYPLSGLLKCSRCGHTMVVGYRSDRKDEEHIKPCWFIDAYGNKCGNKGSKAEIVHSAIREELDVYENELRQSLEGDVTDNKNLLREIDMTLNDIAKLERKLLRIDELVEEEYYTPAEAKSKKADTKIALNEAETKLNLLQIKLNNSKAVTNQERLNLITRFREKMAEDILTAEQINDNYKTIISHIIWDRDGDTYIIKVNFL